MKRLQLYRALACGFAFVATAGLSAQTPQEMAAYFAQRIGQPSVFTPAQGASLSPDALAPARDRVWTAWQEANARLDEPKLPPLLPLTADTKGALALPDSLEPAATMDYYWGSKGGQPAAGWPVYIYLHGSGPREREWSNGLKFATLFEDAPSAYFVPRIPNEGGYYRWWQRSKQWAWSWLLRQLMLDDRLDARKIYVFGISEGGYGSQRLASFYADYWAAAGPMAGGEPLKNAPAENCRNIGFSLLTGADDTGFYRNELSALVQAAFDSLQALHPDAYRHRVELLPGQGHNFDYRPTTPWLRWHRTGFYNLVVNRRPGDLRTRYDVEIAGNRIDLAISEVHYQTVRTDPKWGIELEFARTYTPATGGELTLYLDEHLVDLRQEVSVYVNGKQVYRGRVACSVGSMMESLATFYDRERIYPASILIKY